jgi:4-hydroxy-tetrahydrodipicolinate synthase
MVKGYIPAVVTPFRDGKLDFESFEKYVCHIVHNSGISGIVVCGSTGESLSLSMDEKVELIRRAHDVCSGAVKVIAGVISPITEDCKMFMKSVENVSDGFLCICPFYIKPSQEQIYNHFRALSNCVGKPIILYNNPGRVGTHIGIGTYKKLAEIDNIIATKECDPDITAFSRLKQEVGDRLLILSGNDDTAGEALTLGASGVISVTAGVAPKMCSKMFNAFAQGDMAEFTRIRDLLSPLHSLLFAEPSPAPVKYALSKMGFIQNELRMPLSTIGNELQRMIDAFIDKAALDDLI